MKKIIYKNFRVEVTPYVNFREPNRQDCLEIEKDIKRHCDVDRIEVLWDTEELCEFCELTWDTYEDGLPACCKKAQEEFEKNKEVDKK